jgi:hypothetical protein
VSSPTFFLGTHEPRWLERVDVPLFVSRRRLAGLRRLPRARGTWALDSGGFSELNLFGGWSVGAGAYAAEVRRYRDEVGGLAWAAPQDWMCEPDVVRKTGLSVAEHIRRTVENLLELRAIAPDLPWAPVLQGWTWGDYDACREAYARAGVQLEREPIVGLGTVCRRQATTRAAVLVHLLRLDGIRLHVFGMKTAGLLKVAGDVESADSLAWSFEARKNPGQFGCAHRSCSNCIDYALAWRDLLVHRIARAAAAAEA